ncbi:AdoMet_MTases domain containing protein [Candidatus Methylopumilus universalis]|uniref:class I SAM-dependent methyltransferase n=1 Tax=Candidatus Methylopumilus universalis TaxID=2588536 RepID=UPI003BEF19ED
MKEEEIRPKKVFDEYLRLGELDAIKFFARSLRESVLCPACHSKGIYSFDKHGFSYEECPDCQTLFVSPRPPLEDFFRYYRESDSANYFATTFYKETAEARREMLWRPKAKMVDDILKKYNAEPDEIFDIGGGFGIFAEEYRCLSGVDVTIIEPGPELAEICRKKGLNVIESFLEKININDLKKGPKVFVSFELFEHLHDCGVFFERLSQLMQPGDLFLFTTLSGMGIDIQALWDQSNSISLQHLNFFNPRSIRILIDKFGLEVLEVSTPGKLDLDILYKNREKINDRFIRNLISQSTEESRSLWQKFISDNGFSSHMFVVCQRPIVS